jgi:PiT family inorganic phosphate transporter
VGEPPRLHHPRLHRRIVGAGLKNDPAKVKWGKVTEIVLSWVITLPVAALIAAAVMWALRALSH